MKEELGLDHFECRSWGCIDRHLILVNLRHLFCARVRPQYSASDNVLDGELLSTEQVRRAMNVVLEVPGQPPRKREAAYKAERSWQRYYQDRSATASRSHRKSRDRRLKELGIAPDRIKWLSTQPED